MSPTSPSPVPLVLASASPARLATLRAAGIEPRVVVSGVDEDAVDDLSPHALAGELARRKAEAVASGLAADDPRTLVVGCDSVLDVDGEAHGKPGTADVARRRWHQLRGRTGVLHTGHHVVRPSDGARASATGSTVVVFAALDDAEVDAYVATGEPLGVAGGFTLDGLGGAYVERVDGDPHNVVGLSLPLLRRLVGDLGVAWHDLWTGRRS